MMRHDNNCVVSMLSTVKEQLVSLVRCLMGHAHVPDSPCVTDTLASHVQSVLGSSLSSEVDQSRNHLARVVQDEDVFLSMFHQRPDSVDRGCS